MDCDLLVIGAGLAGLVAATEAAGRGLKVIVLDQEGEQSLGGQAFWSLGGLFFVDSPEQRRMRIRDSIALARQDWFGSAAFDRPEDHWPRLWAEAYLDFASGEKRAWLSAMGMRWFPIVGWAERGGGLATGHGNSVPRFHVTWGTGPGILAPFIARAMELRTSGALSFASAIAWTASSSRTVRSSAPTAPYWWRTKPAVAAPPRARLRAISIFGPALYSSLRAVSAPTTIWCGRTGRATGWASRRASW
jgi:predicted oxidoreductase